MNRGFQAYDKFMNILSRVKYKDNWELSVLPHDPVHKTEFLVFLTTMRVRSIDPPHELTKVSMSHMIPADHILNWGETAIVKHIIFKGITDLEIHEAQEWFLYNDVRVLDPHGASLPLGRDRGKEDRLLEFPCKVCAGTFSHFPTCPMLYKEAKV